MHQGGLNQFIDSKVKNESATYHDPNKSGGVQSGGLSQRHGPGESEIRQWYNPDGVSLNPDTKGDYEDLLRIARSSGGPPDILVTNYSMLEYMLLRPLEHRFWHDTSEWLKIDGNRLLLVLDESHLYQGVMGTEVSMLIQRLRTVLGVGVEKFQFILTSASLGDDSESNEKAKKVLLKL